MKGKVLFIDMYCAEDDRFEMTPPLNDDEVGTEDLLLNVSDLENDILNDAAKILDGMSASKNDASKYAEYTKSITDGRNDGMNEGMNEEMQACTIDRIMFSQLLDILVAKVKDNIWALFICIPRLDIDSGGLKLIESDADVHALYDLA
nr:potassium channel, voltage-dependent, EAG/ELK/ERG, ankyrin repeat-containing domain protein [Tanacetum cinerariifolium]